MNSRLVVALGIASFAFSAWADQSVYCPQNHGYINLGMTADQVVAACGRPLSVQSSNQPVMQKIPVQQLIYNSIGAPQAFYGVWQLQTGVGTGAQLEVDIVDNKVSAVLINGSGSNAFSLCRGTSIQVGDPVGSVYGACGSPTLVNKTFINQPVQSNQQPEIWTYQVDQYQPPISLTFLNGKLQSIN